MHTSIRSFLWILPFLSFLAGYQLLRTLSHVEVIEVPPVVGLHMHDAIKTLSSFQLNVRILAEREDLDVPEGIIITQTPIQGTKVKPHQSIFLVITRRPPKPRAPSLYGLPKDEAIAKAQERGIQLKAYSLESMYPSGKVIAQNSYIDQEVSTKIMAVYVSSGPTSLRIFPDLKGHTVSEVKHFFEPFDIKIQVAHPFTEAHDCGSCIISEQRPVAGTFIDIAKPAVINVTADSKK